MPEPVGHPHPLRPSGLEGKGLGRTGEGPTAVLHVKDARRPPPGQPKLFRVFLPTESFGA